MDRSDSAIDSAEGWIAELGLVPLEFEGGYYRETHRSPTRLPGEVLPGRYPGARALHTAIYFLLTPQTHSVLHRLRGDEVYHFYAGDPVSLVLLGPGSEGRVVRLGNSGGAGLIPQQLVPAGTWQGSVLEPGGRYALMGTTMAPGFELDDFELATGADLRRTYPAFGAWIEKLAAR